MGNHKPLVDLDGNDTSKGLIIVFANQKGGVGKSTLCASCGNYIAAKGHTVAIIDCDSQLSIFKQREKDLLIFKEEEFLYNVQKFDITNPVSAQRLMDQSRKAGIVVIIDCPGSMSQNGLIPVITGADIIVTPFYYDAVSSQTTVDFTKLLEIVSDRFKVDIGRQYFIPNRFNKSRGTKRDLEMWDKLNAYLSTKGTVTPRVMDGADMTRFNTYRNTPRQTELISPAFDCILKDFTDRLG